MACLAAVTGANLNPRKEIRYEVYHFYEALQDSGRRDGRLLRWANLLRSIAALESDLHDAKTTGAIDDSAAMLACVQLVEVRNAVFDGMPG